ncbi:MAG: hypothetical protein ACFFCH_07990 [Promethearchaeota archaeon]
MRKFSKLLLSIVLLLIIITIGVSGLFIFNRSSVLVFSENWDANDGRIQGRTDLASNINLYPGIPGLVEYWIQINFPNSITVNATITSVELTLKMRGEADQVIGFTRFEYNPPLVMLNVSEILLQEIVLLNPFGSGPVSYYDCMVISTFENSTWGFSGTVGTPDIGSVTVHPGFLTPLPWIGSTIIISVICVLVIYWIDLRRSHRVA